MRRPPRASAKGCVAAAVRRSQHASGASQLRSISAWPIHGRSIRQASCGADDRRGRSDRGWGRTRGRRSRQALFEGPHALVVGCWITKGNQNLAPVLQFLRRHLPRLYFTRFAWLLGCFLVLLVPLALRWIPTMFRSTFIVDIGGVFLVSLFATWAAFTVMSTRRVVLLYGHLRFGAEEPPISDRLPLRVVLGYLSVALPLIGSVVWLSATEGALGWMAVAGALGGIGAGAVLMWLATLLQDFVSGPDTTLPEIVLPRSRALTSAHRQEMSASNGLSWWGRFLARLRPLLGPGYFAPDGRSLLPGHGFQLFLAGVFGWIYALGYFFWSPGSSRGAEAPALAFLLIAATLGTYVLGGLAFFLDRHRVPVLLTIALYCSLVWGLSGSDHYFALAEPTSNWASLETPSQIAAHRRQPLLAVVSVDGGGIRAAAWAARALTGIEERWPRFHESARFISAVSGGSVGTMYFVDALHPDRSPNTQELDRVRELATRGSLNEVGWGLAYPDLGHLLLPLPGWHRFEDRGLAMQRAWERDWRPRVPRLSDWIAGVREGWRPAVSFNAVGSENGQRFAFATFGPPDTWGLWTPATAYGDRDVTVSTAARMSAAFPYVSPLARAWPDTPGIYAAHLADGGYYDNTGMGLAMRWLDAALQANGHREDPLVLFIRLRSSAARAEPGELLSHPTGPLETLMNVRVAAQQERADTELEVLQRLWCLQGVEIRTFEFAFEGSDSPLSWQLSAAQKTAIERAWSDPTDPQGGQRNTRTLELLIETTTAPPVTRCQAPRT
jgi:hypothetical protein